MTGAWRSELCNIFIGIFGEDHFTTDLIIIQSSKERRREPEYHSTIDCCHQLLILSTGKLLITIGKQKENKENPTFLIF